MNKLPVLIRLLKKQIVNDVTIECNIIGRSLQLNAETEEQGSFIMDPESKLSKPVTARAITEGFGEVRRICQRYLIMGRDVDDNRMEKIDETNRYSEAVTDGQGGYDLLKGTSYTINVEADKPVTVFSASGTEIAALDKSGQFTYLPSETGCIRLDTESQKVNVVYSWGGYGALELELTMPGNFNLGMVETAKDCAHRMIVDHVIYTLLLNQWPEKSLVYKERFNADTEGLRRALQSRTRFCRHAEDWS